MTATGRQTKISSADLGKSGLVVHLVARSEQNSAAILVHARFRPRFAIRFAANIVLVRGDLAIRQSKSAMAAMTTATGQLTRVSPVDKEQHNLALPRAAQLALKLATALATGELVRRRPKPAMVETTTAMVTRMKGLVAAPSAHLVRVTLHAAPLEYKSATVLVRQDPVCPRLKPAMVATTIATAQPTRASIVDKEQHNLAPPHAAQLDRKPAAVRAAGELVRRRPKPATIAMTTAMAKPTRILPVGRAAREPALLLVAQQVLAPVRHLVPGEPAYLRLKVAATAETTIATAQSMRDVVLMQTTMVMLEWAAVPVAMTATTATPLFIPVRSRFATDWTTTATEQPT
jgi:hypothetical protein